MANKRIPIFLAYVYAEIGAVPLNNVARLASLSEEQRDDLLAYFSEHTKYGLVNAVTCLARETKNADEQIRLEGFGGKLLNTPDKEFEEMVSQEG